MQYPLVDTCTYLVSQNNGPKTLKDVKMRITQHHNKNRNIRR